MLSTWLNYCSSKQKEFADRACRRFDFVVKNLYSATMSNALNNKKALMASNIRMSYANGSVMQRESVANIGMRASTADGRASVFGNQGALGMGLGQQGYIRQSVAPGTNLLAPGGSSSVGSDPLFSSPSLDTHTLKACLTVQSILNNKEAFLETLLAQRETYLNKDLALLTKSLPELKEILVSLLGFFVVQAHIDGVGGGNKAEGFRKFSKIFEEKVGEHLIEISKYGFSIEDILSLKKILHFCIYCSKKLNLPNLEAMYLEGIFFFTQSPRAYFLSTSLK